MSRYRKKPVVIEAERFDGTASRARVLEAWSEGAAEYVDSFIHGAQLSIRTPEGRMMAEQGDWIIRGVAGEYYPCKPHIFEATYEPA